VSHIDCNEIYKLLSCVKIGFDLDKQTKFQILKDTGLYEQTGKIVIYQ